MREAPAPDMGFGSGTAPLRSNNSPHLTNELNPYINAPSPKSSLYEWAKFYYAVGLTPLPAKAKAKNPIVNWKDYEEKRPTPEELSKWFKGKSLRHVNIGTLAGKVSGNLVILDFESVEAYKTFMDTLDRINPDVATKLENETWLVKTGKGYHLYFRTFRELPYFKVPDVVEVRGDSKHFTVLPPSIHPSGRRYAFSNHPTVGIAKLDEEELLAVYKALNEAFGVPIPEDINPTAKAVEVETMATNEPIREVKGTVKAPREFKTLSPVEVYNLLGPYYVPGTRQDLTLYLSGYLAKAKVDIFNAVDIVLTFVENDQQPDAKTKEEVERRLEALFYSYGKVFGLEGLKASYGENLIDKLAEYLNNLLQRYNLSISKEFIEGRLRAKSSPVKGREGLREIIEKVLRSKGFSEEDAHDEGLKVLSELSNLLKVDVERTITIPVKVGSTYYANDPKRGILYLTRKRVRVGNDEIVIWEKEYVLGYYIKEIRVLINPSEDIDRYYNIVFEHPITKDTLTYTEATIEEVSRDLLTKAGVRNPYRLKGAISSIVEAFVTKGLAEVEIKAPATGFFEVEGELKFFESPKFRLNLPPVDIEKTKEAFRKLEELLEFYHFSDRALANLYFDIQAPLGLIRKQYGRENKILFNFGTPHVGKTLIRKLMGYLWGLREDKSVIGASNITAPQLSHKLNQTTLAITLDEVRNALSNPHLADLLKTATTNIHVKSRIDKNRGYRMTEFHAYASPVIITNYVPQLYIGLEDRLIPVEWDITDKRTKEEVSRFEGRLAQYKEDLAYIGSYLRAFYLQNWDRIKPLILNEDQIEAGRKLLVMVYESLGLRVPEWLRPITLEYEIEQPSEEELFLTTIREDLLEKCRMVGVVEVIDPTTEEERTIKESILNLPWRERIEHLAKRGALPEYMVLGRRKIYIKPSLIQAIRKRTGFELAGGLKNLAQLLGYKYDNFKPIGKAMAIPIDDLVEKLPQRIPEEEEDLALIQDLEEVLEATKDNTGFSPVDKVTEGLLKRGWSERDIRHILYKLHDKGELLEFNGRVKLRRGGGG